MTASATPSPENSMVENPMYKTGFLALVLAGTLLSMYTSSSSSSSSSSSTNAKDSTASNISKTIKQTLFIGGRNADLYDTVSDEESDGGLTAACSDDSTSSPTSRPPATHNRRNSKDLKELNWTSSSSSDTSFSDLDYHHETISSAAAAAFFRFKWNYLAVYSLVMMSDWLQGPYIYALYSSFGYSVQEIAILFVVGFLSSALFGTFFGSYADKFGRKRMSLAFCLIYATSCCTKFTPNYTILLFGRLTGGIATSLLFSVFEAWMVSEAKHRNYTETQISDIFAWATYVNGIVAIISGVVANGLVDVYGKTPFGFATPFLAALGILIVAFVLVAATWSENYGEQEDESSSSVVLDLQKNSLLPADAKSMSRSTSTTSGAGGVLSAIKEITQDVGILSVGCMQCFFESAMYTFVFMWSPQLESIKLSGTSLPYGIIFASFMVSIMIGSVIFKTAVKLGNTYEQIATHVFLIASLSLGYCALSTSEVYTFAAFNIFEICCGCYFPTMGTLRSRVVPEASRATVMNVFRFPLNLIVVVALLKVESLSASVVFTLCAVLNLASFLFARRLVLALKG